MTDVGRGNARALVERLFEGENEEHVVGRAADGVDALGAPRPDRGTHEVHRRDAAATQLLFDAEIEIGRVDPHEDLRHRVREAAHEVAAKTHETRQVREHFDVAAHGEFANVVPGVKARFHHARTAHAVLRGALHASRDFGKHEARDEVAARLAREPDGSVLFRGGNRMMVAHGISSVS